MTEKQAAVVVEVEEMQAALLCGGQRFERGCLGVVLLGVDCWEWVLVLDEMEDGVGGGGGGGTWCNLDDRRSTPGRGSNSDGGEEHRVGVGPSGGAVAPV